MGRRRKPAERKPQTAEQRHAQLCRIADALLMRIEHGDMKPAERTQLIRSYEAIDRILQMHGGNGEHMPVIITLADGSTYIDNETNRNILSLAELINNPLPDRDIETIIEDIRPGTITPDTPVIIDDIRREP